LTNSQGQASTTLTLGTNYGEYLVQTSCPGYSVSPVIFHATATSAILIISGYCDYYKNNVPLQSVIVKTSGAGVVTTNSNNEGFYQLQGLEVNGNYTLTPERSIFDDWSAHLITTYQAALTLRNAVGLENFTSSQVKAADVDKDGKVTAYDAALIAQFAVGLSRRTDSHVGEWIFSPSFRSYYDMTTSYQNQNYTGILLGDVTGDWNQSYGQMKATIVQTITCLDDIKTEPGKIIIPIKIKGDQEVVSWQLHLKFDPDKLKFNLAKKDVAGSKLQLLQNSGDGNLYLGMYGSEGIFSDESFAEIIFDVLETSNDKIELEIPYFQVNNNPVQQGSIAFDIDGVIPEDFVLLQNYPNPFNPATTITYQIPEAGSVKLVIFNLSGQEIITLEDRNQQAGLHQIEWSGLDKAGSEVVSGVYFCYLHFRDQVKTIKLLKVK
jgi:hypothetical protein